MIPLVDLRAQHALMADEILVAMRDVLERGAFVGGRYVESFEREWADFCASREAIGIASGTDALRFALIASGVGQGDEVITVPFTFAATLEAILQAGARPVLVDVDPTTCTLDPSGLEQVLSKRTKAIVPVHLYGHPADMDPILQFADQHQLVIVEDAAQAHGAVYKGRRSGSLGQAAAFSFYPSKNLGACGEAGAVTTDDPELARKVRMLRDHGQCEKNNHEIAGYNGKLDAIQAAVLRIKLRHLAEWNESRRSLSALYRECLSGVPDLILPEEAPWAGSAWHLYVVRTPRRDELREKLEMRGISTGLHYPKPLHLQKAFASLGYGPGSFPVSEELAQQVLSLPLYPEMAQDTVQRISDQIKSIMA